MLLTRYYPTRPRTTATVNGLIHGETAELVSGSVPSATISQPSGGRMALLYSG